MWNRVGLLTKVTTKKLSVKKFPALTLCWSVLRWFPCHYWLSQQQHNLLQTTLILALSAHNWKTSSVSAIFYFKHFHQRTKYVVCNWSVPIKDSQASYLSGGFIQQGPKIWKYVMKIQHRNLTTARPISK